MGGSSHPTWENIKKQAGKVPALHLSMMVRAYTGWRYPRVTMAEVYQWLSKRGYRDTIGDQLMAQRGLKPSASSIMEPASVGFHNEMEDARVTDLMRRFHPAMIYGYPLEDHMTHYTKELGTAFKDATSPFAKDSPADVLFRSYQNAARSERQAARNLERCKADHDACKKVSQEYERAIRAVTGKKCPAPLVQCGDATPR